VATSVCLEDAGDPLGLIGLEFTSEDALGVFVRWAGKIATCSLICAKSFSGIKRSGGSGFAYCTTPLH
jgi:hypothetical protein